MEFNPSKYEHLTVTNRHSFIQSIYKICGQPIKKVPCAKYLGVIFDQHLTWKDHISHICGKANVIKAFLQRNLLHCPKHVKSNCYKTLLRPVLEYAATVWSPFTQSDISRLERVQKRAACFVMCDYSRYSSVSAMITSLNWPTLEQRRNYLKLVMFYKIIRGFAIIPSLSLIPMCTSTEDMYKD